MPIFAMLCKKKPSPLLVISTGAVSGQNGQSCFWFSNGCAIGIVTWQMFIKREMSSVFVCFVICAHCAAKKILSYLLCRLQAAPRAMGAPVVRFRIQKTLFGNESLMFATTLVRLQRFATRHYAPLIHRQNVCGFIACTHCFRWCSF